VSVPLPGQFVLFGGGAEQGPEPQPGPKPIERCEACGGPLFGCECCTTPGFAKAEAQQRAIGNHEASLERLVPLAKELAERAGAHGVTVGDIRLRAQREGLLPQAPEGRALSYLAGLPRRAGLIATGRRRMSPLPRSRNDHMIHVLPKFFEAP
jgi:hypothetical protein